MNNRKNPTQAEIADLMRPALEALPLTNEWQEVVVIVKRNDDQSLALHSIVMQPAFEQGEQEQFDEQPLTQVVQLPPIPPGYALHMVGDVLSIEPIEQGSATAGLN